MHRLKKQTIALSILIVSVISQFTLQAIAYQFRQMEPCFMNPNGKRYCSINQGYFYDKATKLYWARVTWHGPYNNEDTKYINYDPVTKKAKWIQAPQSVLISDVTAADRQVAKNGTRMNCYLYGDKDQCVAYEKIKNEGYIGFNETVKTQAQIEAEKFKKEKTAKARIAAEVKAKEALKSKHQKALTAAKEAGTLPSCKKLYWKLQLNPLNLYSETNPKPFEDIEGTEKTYCQLKDGSTTMLQFQDTTSPTTGAKYRELKLIDFTGKTKYYPWN